MRVAIIIKDFKNSLPAIQQELNNDVGFGADTTPINHKAWERQGVVVFTPDAGIKTITKNASENSVFMILGEDGDSNALAYQFSEAEYFVIHTGEPLDGTSPKPFQHSCPFGEVNGWFMLRGESPIFWGDITV